MTGLALAVLLFGAFGADAAAERAASSTEVAVVSDNEPVEYDENGMIVSTEASRLDEAGKNVGKCRRQNMFRCCNPNPPDCAYDAASDADQGLPFNKKKARREQEDWKYCCEGATRTDERDEAWYEDGEEEVENGYSIFNFCAPGGRQTHGRDVDEDGKDVKQVNAQGHVVGNRDELDRPGCPGEPMPWGYGDLGSPSQQNEVELLAKRQANWMHDMVKKIRGSGNWKAQLSKVESTDVQNWQEADDGPRKAQAGWNSQAGTGEVGAHGGISSHAGGAGEDDQTRGGHAVGLGGSGPGTQDKSWAGWTWKLANDELGSLTDKVMRMLKEAATMAEAKALEMPAQLHKWELMEKGLGLFLTRRQQFWEQAQLDIQLKQEDLKRQGEATAEENQAKIDELYHNLEPQEKLIRKKLVEERQTLWRAFNKSFDDLQVNAEDKAQSMKDMQHEFDGRWTQWINLIDWVAQGSTNEAIQEAKEDMNDFARQATRLLGENQIVIGNAKRATDSEIQTIVRASNIGMKKTVKVLSKELKAMSKMNLKEAALAGKRFEKEVKSATKEMKSIQMMLSAHLARGMKSEVIKPLSVLKAQAGVNAQQAMRIKETEAALTAEGAETQKTLDTYFTNVNDAWEHSKHTMEAESASQEGEMREQLAKQLTQADWNYMRDQNRAVTESSQMLSQQLDLMMGTFHGTRKQGQKLVDLTKKTYAKYEYQLNQILANVMHLTQDHGRLYDAKARVDKLRPRSLEDGEEITPDTVEAQLQTHTDDFEEAIERILQESEKSAYDSAKRAMANANDDVNEAYVKAQSRLAPAASTLALDVTKLAHAPDYYSQMQDHIIKRLNAEVLNDLEPKTKGLSNILSEVMGEHKPDQASSELSPGDYDDSIQDTKNMLKNTYAKTDEALKTLWDGGHEDLEGVGAKLLKQGQKLMKDIGDIRQDDFRTPMQEEYAKVKTARNDAGAKLREQTAAAKVYFEGTKADDDTALAALAQQVSKGTVSKDSVSIQTRERDRILALDDSETKKAEDLGQEWGAFASDQNRFLTSNAARASDVTAALKLEAENQQKIIQAKSDQAITELGTDMTDEEKEMLEDKDEVERTADERLAPPAKAADEYKAKEDEELDDNVKVLKGNLKAHRKAVLHLKEHSVANRNAMNAMISRITSQVGAAQNNLQLAAIAAETDVNKQRQALRQRAEAMKSNVDQMFGGSDAALASSMNHAISASHQAMEESLTSEGRSQQAIENALHAEEERLKEELGQIRQNGADLLSFSDEYARQQQAGAQQAAGAVSGVGAGVAGEQVAQDQTMSDVGKEGAGQISLSASHAEQLMSAIKHENRAIEDVYTDMGNHFRSKLQALKDHALAENVDVERQVELVSRATADAAAAGADQDEHLRKHAADAAVQLNDMKQTLQAGLSHSAEAMKHEAQQVSAAVEQVQAKAGVDVRGLAGRLTASAEGFEKALDAAEVQERDKEQEEREREIKLLKVNNLETAHTIDAATDLLQAVREQDLDHTGLAQWQAGFAAKSLAWKNLVASKFGELGISIHQTELQAAHAEEQEALAAQLAAAQEERRAEQELSAQERKLQNQIGAVYAKADAEIHAIMNDANLSDEEKAKKVAEIRARAKQEAQNYAVEAEKMEKRQRELEQSLNRYKELVAEAKDAAERAVAAGHLAPTALAVHEKLEAVSNELSKLQLNPWVIPTTVLETSDPHAALVQENERLKAANAKVAAEIRSAEARLAAAKRSPIANSVVA